MDLVDYIAVYLYKHDFIIPDIVIENENKTYIIDITMALDWEEHMYNANSKKIEKYCDLGFVIPYFTSLINQQ